MKAKLVLLGKMGDLRKAFSLVSQIGELIHEKSVAGGGCKGIDDDDRSLRILLRQKISREICGIQDAGNAGGEGQVENIFSFLQERLKIFCEFLDIDLGGPGGFSGSHFFVELIERHGLAEIVRVIFSVKLIVEADILDVAFEKMLF